MKFALSKIEGVWLSNLAGCPNGYTTDAVGSYTSMIDSSPAKVTVAARTAAGEQRLLEIVSSGTTMGGTVSARSACGEDVSIDIEEAGQDVSQVKIRIGATGDESVSEQLIERIRGLLLWF